MLFVMELIKKRVAKYTKALLYDTKVIVQTSKPLMMMINTSKNWSKTMDRKFCKNNVIFFFFFKTFYNKVIINVLPKKF
jgi:hypothetical protein